MSEPKGLGHFHGKVHILPIRIYYEDTDLSGVVYHANYLRFMERGRSEYFRLAEIPLATLEDAEPTAWTLRKIGLEYLKPARLEDTIEVHTACTTVTGARMTAEQKVMCRGQVLVKGHVEACIITLSGKVRRIGPETRDKLAPLLVETTS